VDSVFRSVEPRLPEIAFGPAHETAIVGHAADAVGLRIVTGAREFNDALEVIVDGSVAGTVELDLRADMHRAVQPFAQFLFGSALGQFEVRVQEVSSCFLSAPP
jgi:hypothetical protein